jgi:hypothetical protein
MILTTCWIACHLVATSLLIQIYDDSLLNLSNNFYHLTSFMGFCSYLFESHIGYLSWLGTVAGGGPPELIYETNNIFTMNRLMMREKMSITFFNQAVFGYLTCRLDLLFLLPKTSRISIKMIHAQVSNKFSNPISMPISVFQLI